MEEIRRLTVNITRVACGFRTVRSAAGCTLTVALEWVILLIPSCVTKTPGACVSGLVAV